MNALLLVVDAAHDTTLPEENVFSRPHPERVRVGVVVWCLVASHFCTEYRIGYRVWCGR